MLALLHTLGDSVRAAVDAFDGDYVQYTITFAVCVFAWEMLLALRQHRNYGAEVSRPAAIRSFVTPSMFRKAQAYGRDKSTYSLLHSTFSAMLTLHHLRAFWAATLWYAAARQLEQLGYGVAGPDNEVVHTLLFLTFSGAIDSVLEVPWSLYYTFVVEERHGMNNQTLTLWCTDLLKSTTLSVVIGFPLIAVFVKAVRWGGESFYLYLWVLVFVFQIFAMWLYPTLVQPCFNKVEPLPRGALRTAIQRLARSIDFPLTELYTIDGSKRSNHSNAYFYGFFKWKRIVLFDTLVDQCTIKECVAILGHELGHWKMNHTVKLIVVIQLNMFCTFFLYGAVKDNARLFQAFGFTPTTVDGQPYFPVIIGFSLFSIIYSPVQHVLSFLMNVLSRVHEFQADAYAARLGYARELADGLIKLQTKNLGTMVPDAWYAAYHYSHPPVTERLQALYTAVAGSSDGDSDGASDSGSDSDSGGGSDNDSDRVTQSSSPVTKKKPPSRTANKKKASGKKSTKKKATPKRGSSKVSSSKKKKKKTTTKSSAKKKSSSKKASPVRRRVTRASKK